MNKITIVCIWLCLQMCACTKAITPSENDQVLNGVDPTRNSNAIIADLDYSIEISSCRDYLLDEKMPIGPIKTSSELPDFELSAGEERILGSWCKPDGYCQSVYETSDRVIMFYRETGRFPVDGAELILWMHPEYRDASKLDTLLSDLSRDEQLSRFAIAINPMTGKFYSSFTDVDQPNSLSYRICSDDTVMKEYFQGASSAWRKEVLSNSSKLVFITKVYGENGSLILDKVAISNSGNNTGDFPGGNPCNPCTSNPCNPCTSNPCK